MAVVGELVALFTGNNAALLATTAQSEAALRGYSATAAQHHSIVASAATAAGVAVIASGAAAVVGLGLAANAAGDFQEQMAVINTIAHQTPEELNKTGDSIRRMAAATGEPLSDLTKAFYDLLSAGVPVKDAMSVLGNSTTLAIGGLATTAQTVDLLTTAMNAYHLTAKGVAVATDQFALAVQDGKVTADQIASTFADIAPLAKQAGIGIDEIAAGYAHFTANGVPAAEFTTQMNRAIVELLKPNADLAALQNKLGVSFADIASQKGLVVALQDMRIAAEQNHVPFQNLFGRLEGLKFALSTTGGNFAEYEAELKKMHEANGTAAEQAAERMGTFQRQTAILGETFNNLLITVGTPLIPFLTSFVQWLTAGADAIGNWVSQFPNIGAAVASLVPPGVAAAISAVAGALGSIASAALTGLSQVPSLVGAAADAISGPLNTALGAIPGLAAAAGGALSTVLAAGLDALQSAISWLGDHQDVIPLVAGAIAGPLVLAFGAWAVSAGAAAAATIAALAPIIAIGAAVGALAAAFITDFGGIRTTVTSAVATIAPIIQGVLGSAIKFVSDALSVVIGWISNFVSHLTGSTNASGQAASAAQTLGSILSTIATIVGTVVGAVAGFVGWTIQAADKLGVFKNAGDLINGMFGLLGDAVRTILGLFGLLADLVGSKVSAAFGALKTVFDAITGAVNTAIDAIKNMIGLAGQAVDAVSKVPGVKLVGDTAGAVGGAVGSAAGAVGDVLGHLPIPHFASGGTVPGTGPQLAVVHGGETVIPTGQGGGATEVHRHIHIEIGGRELVEYIERELFSNASSFSSGFAAANPVTGA